MPTLQDFDIASTMVRYNRNNRMMLAYLSRPRDFYHYPGDEPPPGPSTKIRCPGGWWLRVR